MKRVGRNSKWSLFYPTEAPNRHEVHGEELEKFFERYEREGRAKKTIDTQQPWFAVLDAQIEIVVLLYFIQMLLMVSPPTFYLC